MKARKNLAFLYFNRNKNIFNTYNIIVKRLIINNKFNGVDNMKDLIEEVKGIIYNPILWNDEKTEHIIKLLNVAYSQGYHQGMDDMLHDVRKLLKDEFGD